MSDMNLQQLIDSQANIVEFLRNQQVGPNVYPGIPGEYSNWRDEQRAWAETAVLFNQSFHMVDLLVTGPVRSTCCPISHPTASRDLSPTAPSNSLR